MHQLAHWGLRSLGPPTADDVLRPGWLPPALRTAFPPSATTACIEFHIGDERATLVDGDVRDGPGDRPDAVVEGDVAGLYRLFVDRDLDAVAITGDRGAVGELLTTLPPPPAVAAAVG